MRWIISFLLIVSCHFAKAQIYQPDRYEIEIGNNEQDFHVVTHSDNSVLLFRKGNFTVEPSYVNWEIIKLNESLKEEWKINYLVKNSAIFLKHKMVDSHLCLLFRASNSYDLTVLVINVKDGTYGYYNMKSHIPFAINLFEINGKGIFVGGLYNYRPVVLFYKYDLNQTLVLPNLFTEKGSLHQVATYENTFDVVLGNEYSKQKIINIYTFNYNGHMLQKQTIFPKRKWSLQSGALLKIDDKKIVAGTFGKLQREDSRGLYIASINEDNTSVNYYSYSDLENFFNYKNEKKVKRIKRRILKKKAAGKQLNFNYRIAVHKLQKIEDQLVLIGEGFYPRYKYSSSFYPTYSAHNYNSFDRYQIFDGYRFTHAVIVGFDKKGNLLWDNCFEISGVENKNLEPVVQVSQTQDEMLLYYNKGDNLATQLISKGRVLKNEEPIPISLMYKDDELKKFYTVSGNQSGVVKGTNNTFYAYGVQKIKNQTDKGVKLNRKVFFINKVIYK